MFVDFPAAPMRPESLSGLEEQVVFIKDSTETSTATIGCKHFGPASPLRRPRLSIALGPSSRTRPSSEDLDLRASNSGKQPEIAPPHTLCVAAIFRTNQQNTTLCPQTISSFPRL
uniref:Uncharacterized protein n=1 Tax=Rhizophora mucronata TaxID=61149 RepID=A0A2P2IKN2_RHIMU